MFLIFLIFFPSFFIFSFSCDPSSGTTWQWFPLVFLFFFFFNFLSSSSCHPSDNRFFSLPLGWVGFPFLFFSLYSLLTRDETTAFLMGGKAINSPTPFTQISWQERPCPAWRVPLSKRLIFRPLLAEGHQNMSEDAKCAPGRRTEDLGAFWTVCWWAACQ